MACISAFLAPPEKLSRTLTSLPRNGNTPKVFLPTTESPEMARDFAESPSHRINVHSFDLDVPAYVASSSFGMARRAFLASCLATDASSFWVDSFSRCSISPKRFEVSFLSTSAGMSHLEPNFDAGVVNTSFC